VIAVSEELKMLSMHFGSDNKKTIRLSNVIDTKRFFPSSEKVATRKKLNIPLEVPVVLSLRRLSKKNGVHYLLKSAKTIISQNSQTMFLICGDGEEHVNLLQLAHELNISQNIIFTGNVPNDIIYDYIISSDIAVFPSLAEATSIACLEVMACGIPVVASDVGGLPEIIQHGETGMLVKFGISASTFEDPGLDNSVIDELARTTLALIRDSELREKIGKQAALTVRKNHTWDDYGKQIIDIYRQAIQKGHV
jgi:glycosyltransferase involved in cell wall biosynthesis